MKRTQYGFDNNTRLIRTEIGKVKDELIERSLQVKKFVSSQIHFDYQVLFSMPIYSHLLRLVELLDGALLEKYIISMFRFIFKESFISYLKLDKYFPGLVTFVKINKIIIKFALGVKFIAYIICKGYYLYYLFFLIG